MSRTLNLLASPALWVAVFLVALLLGNAAVAAGIEWGFPGVSRRSTNA